MKCRVDKIFDYVAKYQHYPGYPTQVEVSHQRGHQLKMGVKDEVYGNADVAHLYFLIEAVKPEQVHHQMIQQWEV